MWKRSCSNSALEAAALRADHVHLELRVFQEGIVLDERLEGEHERILDRLGHLANRQAHLEQTRRAGFVRSLRSRIENARHDPQFVHLALLFF